MAVNITVHTTNFNIVDDYVPESQQAQALNDKKRQEDITVMVNNHFAYISELESTTYHDGWAKIPSADVIGHRMNRSKYIEYFGIKTSTVSP